MKIDPADRAWSFIVRHGYGWVCCQCKKVYPADCGRSLQAAHIISRTWKNTRWDKRNGVSLCAQCHFRAHNDPLAFADFIRQQLSDEIIVALRAQAANPDKSIAESLRAQIIGEYNALTPDHPIRVAIRQHRRRIKAKHGKPDYEKHKEQRKLHARRYYEQHKAEQGARHRAYYAKHKDRLNAHAAEWRRRKKAAMKMHNGEIAQEALFDGSPDDRTPSLDAQRRDALRR